MWTMPEQRDEKATERLSFRVPPSMVRAIYRASDREERTVSQWLRLRVKAVLDDEERARDGRGRGVTPS